MIRKIGPFVPFGESRLSKSDGDLNVKLNEDGVELAWAGKEVIWSKNRCLLHHFHMPGCVIDTTLCTVDNREFLAVLYKSGLTLFAVGGHSFLIPLPFQIARIFPLHKALLLLRSESSALVHSQYADFPILFTLFHPLEEIRPVAFFTSISISSPLPKFTIIPSPRRGNDLLSTPPMRQFPFTEDEKLRFITDLSFTPLTVTKEKCFLLAKSSDSVSIWRFTKPQGNRDLLFASPMFLRPSVFSPVSNAVNSPNAVRAGMKATLEGIPPDLFMEMIFEFNQIDPTEEATLIEMSEGDRRMFLFLHKHGLQALDVSDIDTQNVAFTIANVVMVCTFEKLMFFVVTTEKELVLYEEDKAIVQFPFENVVEILKNGRNFIIRKGDGSSEVFQFQLTFDPVVKKILGLAHSVMDPTAYSTVVLALSDSECLKNCEIFTETFTELLLSLVSDEDVLRSFVHVGHRLFQEMRVCKQDDYCRKLVTFLLPLAKHFGMQQHVLYYAMYGGLEIEEDYRLSSNDHVDDVLYWCSQCTTGRVLGSPATTGHAISSKLVAIFGAFSSIRELRDVVVNVDKAKLTVEEFQKLHPSVVEPLECAFRATADSPPDAWPLAAYQLIGRPDVRTLKEYVAKPSAVHVQFYEESDLRFIEVERLLQSHMSVTVDVERPNGTDDIQFQAMLVGRLKILLARQWSLSVGRGLFKLQTFEPESSQNLESGPLTSSGFTTNSIELKAGTDFETPEILEWPQFHNGVSDGLTVLSADRDWLLDAATKDMSPYAAGVLFGFGLTGELKKLWKVDLYQYLTTPNIKATNSCALLLGLGVAYRGVRDLGLSHMFTLHIPELRQFQQTEYDHSPMIQACASIGIALLFQGSGQRHITETFISLLERSAIFEVASHTFALGAAIGLVNLGMGDDSSALREHRERLCVIFSGSKVGDVSNERIITFGNSDFYAVAPSAILALTLGYMRTNHSRVKIAMELPNDANFINAMPPDVIIMRIIGLAMVDPDPNTALNFTIPDGLNPEILASFVTGYAVACGVKLAGTLNIKAFERLQMIARCLCLLETVPFDFTDCPAVRREQCLALVLLSCSLIVAGTCDVALLRLIRYARRRSVTTNGKQSVYALHAIFGMAIGVLNLGKGRYTIGSSNADSAAILIAMFPRFPLDPADNRFMMQPLWHLIAAASVPRVLEVRDVDTNAILNMYVSVGLSDGNEMAVKAPHVLPPFAGIAGLRVDDPDYFVVDLAVFPFKDERVRPIVWLKKRQSASEKEPLGIEALRTTRCMNYNPAFASDPGDSQGTAIVKLNTEWDKIVDDIMRFLRCESIAERSRMMIKEPKIKDFLLFHGLFPSTSIQDAQMFCDDALAFILPHLTADECAKAFS